ncbi:MAG: glycoside hydrolase domain-containing protein [Myxococcales bacterium]
MTLTPRRLALLFTLPLAVSCGAPGEAPLDGNLGTNANDLQVGPAARGLDRASALSVAEARDYKSRYGVTWTGAYIGGACNGGSGWDEGTLVAISDATGWQIMPIYVGQNGPGLGCPCNLSYGQGTADGDDAVNVMKSYHWAPHANIPVVLDVEAETYGNNPSGASSYVRGWLDAVHRGGYLAYVYSNPDGLSAFHSQGLPIDGAWVANYMYNCFDGSLSPYSDPYFSDYKNRAWQYTDCGGSIDFDTANILLAPAPGKTNASPAALPSALDQVENNGGLTAVNWADGHVEVFARTNSDRVVHVWTDGATDRWHAPAELQGAAGCGVASVDSFAGGEHAEVFDSSSNGGDTRSTDFSNGWKTFADFGGRNLVEVSTLRWSDEASGGWTDGRTEVFGLAAGDHQIYHKYYDPFDKHWKGWASIGGELATGVSPILNKSGDADIFALDHDGIAWYDESVKATGDGWRGWRLIGGGKLASRPAVVRDSGGVLRLFARGQDGKLYGSHSTSDGFSHFELLESDFDLAGEPSAAIDGDNVEVFVRGLSGKVSRATLDGKTHKLGRFDRMSEDQFSSDPFAWRRPDGHVDVFAVTTNGHLAVSAHAANGWKPFERIATGVDACVAPEVTPECPNGVDGTYCGGHEVKGNSGTLYECRAGKVTELQACSAGCQDVGNGGQDACTPSTPACSQNSDCPSNEVCEQPALICGGETGANQCTTDVMALQGQQCSSNADCNVPGGTALVCQACPSGCGGNCCQVG